MEKEALALVLAVRYLSVYIGTGVATVYTDHNSLVFLQRIPEGDRLPEGCSQQAAVGPRGSGGTLKM